MLKDTIRKYIIDDHLLAADVEDFNDDTSFMAMEILDSTGIQELVTFLECEFNIKIEDDELLPDNLDSVNKITRFVQSKKGGGCL